MSDIREIEPETVTCSFGDETFFTIFSQQLEVYQTILNQMQEFGGDKDRKLLREDLRGGIENHKRELSAILLKPTALNCHDSDQVMPMPILKECLLFEDIKATVLIFILKRKSSGLYHIISKF